MASIRFEDLTLGYERHPAVHHLNGAIPAGSLLAVVGPNGSGKSTLLKGVMGVLRPFAGRIRFDGVRRDEIAYLPQQMDIDRNFPITVFDMVSLGLWREIGLFAGLGRARVEKVEEALASVGLAGFERRTIGSLSSGQLQRVLFARLLLRDAPIILLDEPFTAIDAKTAADLMALVRRWHGEDRTVVAVLHDLTQVRENFPHSLLLARTAVSWGKTDEVLTGENLRRALQLCEAWDDQADVCRHGRAA
jgi:zinc/manganese transport system ATP-binding protein